MRLARRLEPTEMIVASCLVGGAALAWAWLLGAGQGRMGAMAVAPPPWSAAYLGASFVMWLLMMSAMMLPSAAPMILLYARLAGRAGAARSLGHTALFAATYAGIWAAFSAAAVLFQSLLLSRGAIGPMDLFLTNSGATGVLLVATGTWQLSPWKQTCLATCRSPLSFLMRLWKPGAAGAVRLGLAHGGYCLGCCWALMLLLFTGGVMNIAWIAALTGFVLAERLMPPPILKAVGWSIILIGAILIGYRP